MWYLIQFEMEFGGLSSNRNNPGKGSTAEPKLKAKNSSVENFSTEQTTESNNIKQTVEDSRVQVDSKQKNAQSSYKKFKSSSNWSK